MFKTVLFAIDQSREAREAAERVINIVQTYQSNLYLLAVVEPKEPDGEPPHSEPMTSPDTVSQLLQEAHGIFSELGIDAKLIEREGKPAFTICDVADEIDADLIVMGSRGTGLTEEGVADSITNRVINLSPCPVLVVP
ncbi:MULTISPECIES: universal stress protein [Arthrospira]|jgi:nucleotide-binding universal stress UspA family protein|uniref:UspA domain-containing protein n=1 Tax=Limnospira platensis NIES-46 TaxID=1236695 RepID=A0A5M3T148_LIMPL|nr:MULTISPECIES: universal stress protein [Arthrospira]AMW29020.1 universal stress protein [Arthrospira platensis YZ]KDR57857.1 universal stress protein [Arthrospira platensis str. Paraca]MBD2667859.1 universal stress protein [Arthrospira platensis FACHB-439]MBD2708671.1 universal stress protein [Arthrospira platensis FACHB-835]MDF2212839.1 universal stress protein [Arthrospira platensis NCB002]MDT9295053.1 universal stress protein [Arthrospira platensis PCC 7345]MDT9310526.1 universal stres